MQSVPFPSSGDPLEARNKAGKASPNITIVPAFLNFKKRPTCIPQKEGIILMNKETAGELHVYSVSSNTPNFQASDFKKVTLAPGQSSSFTVIFLPRTLGVVHATLVIETSMGGFVYALQGEGTANAYKATALLDVKVPVGVNSKATFELFNPHAAPLRIKEIFTNQGFLHLMLPPGPSLLPSERKRSSSNSITSSSSSTGSSSTGSISSPSGASAHSDEGGLWVVPTHKSSHIINLSFQSNTPGKHSGFIHVRTDADDLVIPVELNVMKGGLHFLPEEIVFDTMIVPGQKKDVPIGLLNSTPNPIAIVEVSSATPADPQLKLSFRKGTVVGAGSERVIAAATYTGTREGTFSGKIQVRTNASAPEYRLLEVPYETRVVFGSIQTSSANTTFIVGSPPLEPVEKQITISNRFPHPLQLSSATVEDPSFDVVDFVPDTVVPVGSRSRPIVIRFTPQSTMALFTTSLALATNITTLHIPIQCYHGRLILQNHAGIDAGLMGVNTSVIRFFNLSNPNPIKVPILAINNSIPGVELSLAAMRGPKGEIGHHDIKALLAAGGSGGTKNNKAKAATPWHIPPSSVVVFRVDISSSKEQEVLGNIVFLTEHEPLNVTVSYRSLEGALSVEPIPALDPTFPGRIVRQHIFATSTYHFPLKLTSITSSDMRFTTTISNSTLLPGVRTKIGKVTFDPSKGPTEDAYMGGSYWHRVSTEGVARWRDVQRMESLDTQWESLQARLGHKIEAYLSLTTDISVVTAVMARASLIRPVLLPHGDDLSFPLTQIGSAAHEHIAIENPSDHALHVQLLPPPTDSVGRDPTTPARCSSTKTCVQSSTFLLPDKMINKGILVPPHAHALLGPIFFAPKHDGMFAATLYLRNNLTLMQSIRLRGEGGSGALHVMHEGKQSDRLQFRLTHGVYCIYVCLFVWACVRVCMCVCSACHA